MKRDIPFNELILMGRLLKAQETLVDEAKNQYLTYGEEQPETYVNCILAYENIQKILSKITNRGEKDDQEGN